MSSARALAAVSTACTIARVGLPGDLLTDDDRPRLRLRVGRAVRKAASSGLASSRLSNSQSSIARNASNCDGCPAGFVPSTCSSSLAMSAQRRRVVPVALASACVRPGSRDWATRRSSSAVDSGNR